MHFLLGFSKSRMQMVNTLLLMTVSNLQSEGVYSGQVT